MKTVVDARLREEAKRLAFRFACEDCAHFGQEEERCSLGYLAAPRRAALDDGPGAEVRVSLELCKAFELA